MRKGVWISIAGACAALIFLIVCIGGYVGRSGRKNQAETVESAAEGSGSAGEAFSGEENAEIIVCKIGMIGSMEGENAEHTLAVMGGMQMAVDAWNLAGGIRGALVEMSWQDTAEGMESLWEWGASAVLCVQTEETSGSWDWEDHAGYEDFCQKYEQRYGSAPGGWAADGYWCVYTWAEALETGEEAAWEEFCGREYDTVTVTTAE